MPPPTAISPARPHPGPGQGSITSGSLSPTCLQSKVTGQPCAWSCFQSGQACLVPFLPSTLDVPEFLGAPRGPFWPPQPECISSSQPRILETLRFSGHFQHTRAVSPAILSICGLQGVELGSKCSVNHEHTPSRGTVCQDNSPGQIGSPLPPRGSLRTQTRVRQAPPRTGQPRHQQLAGLVLLLPTRIPEMRPGGAPQ